MKPDLTQNESNLWDICQKWKFKALQNTFKTVKSIVIFVFDSQLTRLIQNEPNTAISNHFTKPVAYIRKTSGTIFSTDVYISGGQVIQYKHGCIPLEAFASNKNFRNGHLRFLKIWSSLYIYKYLLTWSYLKLLT